MAPQIALMTVVAFGVSALLTGAVRKLVLSRGLVDVPNARSSHKTPTPRGGGLAIVLTTTVALVGFAVRGTIQLDLLIALAGGGIAVAIVGFIDDSRQLSARLRLTVHFGAALWALAWLGGVPPLRIANDVLVFGWTGYVLGALGIVWTVNLFNFMDGIDGLAASEAVFIGWSCALLALTTGASGSVGAVGLAFGAVCCGFGLWNWPPARIFMGDVGSGYIGYVVAVLALAAARENPVALFVWLMLGGVFFVDATITLVRRLARGERVHEAHCTHAYQRLARRWGSHRRVAVAVMTLNLAWLLPCAYLATVYPERVVWIVIIALVPVVALAVAAGAGRNESMRTD